MNAVIAWLNRDLWAPMWPNMFAPSVFTLIGVGVSHIKLKRHHAAQVGSIHERLDQNEAESGDHE